jgi:PPOX class probable F420-dependent enzyme
MAQLSEPVRKLLEQPNFGHLATVMPDGSPQVTTVWVDTDGEHILVNTAEGRQKPRNIQRDGRVAINVVDQSNPYRQAMIRGKIVDVTTEGADAHIDRLAKKYLGRDTYPNRQPGERRVVLKIEPTRVASQGLES